MSPEDLATGEAGVRAAVTDPELAGQAFLPPGVTAERAEDPAASIRAAGPAGQSRPKCR